MPQFNPKLLPQVPKTKRNTKTVRGQKGCSMFFDPGCRTAALGGEVGVTGLLARTSAVVSSIVVRSMRFILVIT